jgi:hypothetical protein
MNGAEPIIYKLAAFDLKRQRMPAPALEPGTALADASAVPPVAVPVPVQEPMPAPEPQVRVVQREAPPPQPRPRPVESRPEPRPEPRVEPRPEPRTEPVRATASRPSFNCRSARSRSERMVCSSDSLAAKDRAMSSLFYSALADADPRTRAELRRTRDRFLAYRERCGSEACVAEAYDGRVQEIRDIIGDPR